ncbi:carbohydrate ABC transporter membrane protein 1, CUT1 family [Actinacidiphila alni]|uniref:Carbohydrate ABC transporter membrane protein 1, CUT1 family n=1 Tax=Actinacidiphila alni TaxID=380248 RepID=A0A1I2MTX1_9ACTN|nr:carbohydrate ABC transporter membrane protein 1, CUT1 family [Actinacidiphila alni]
MAIAERDATRRADAAGASEGRVKPGRGSRRKRLRRDAVLLALMVPGVAYFLLFHYGAMVGNVIAFKDYVPFDGLWASQWVGFSNFQRMFEDPDFWAAVVNTLWIALLQLVFFFPVPIALAMLLHSLTRDSVRRFVQSVAYLPHFLSWVIVVALFQQVLGETGALNSLLGDAHLHTVNIIGNPDAFKPLVVAQVIWKDCGWGTIIFLAALSQVDEQQYEAAAIDGAGPWRRFWHVTLPSMRPIIVLLLIMRLGDILSVGFEQMLLQRPSVGPEAAEIIDTFVYYKGIIGGDFGYAAAAGLFKGVVGAVLVYAANKVAHRLGEQGVYR